MIPSTASISVLVVDDHPIMRMGIASIIDGGGMNVVGQAGTGADAVRMHRQLSPDVTLMDLRLPDLSGVEAIRQIRLHAPQARIVVLTTYEGDEDIHQALRAGAGAYLIKGMSHEALLKAIRQVHRGARFLPHSIVETLQSRDPSSPIPTSRRPTSPTSSPPRGDPAASSTGREISNAPPGSLATRTSASSCRTPSAGSQKTTPPRPSKARASSRSSRGRPRRLRPPCAQLQ
jgi:DNA-binding NarL/FixJ family response regulator